MTSARGLPADESLSVERTDRDDCVLLIVRGDLDLATEGRLLAAAFEVLREKVGCPLVLDLSGVRFIESIGYSELLMISHDATSSRQEVRIVVGGNRRLRGMVGLLGPLPIYDSIDDAHPIRAADRRPLSAALPEEPRADTDRLGA